MGCIYRAENCKNHFKIVGQIIFKKKKDKKNDVAADVAQRESSSIKRYASAFRKMKGNRKNDINVDGSGEMKR